MASGVYLKGAVALLNGTINWASDTINAQLTANTYTFNETARDTHDFRDDVVAHAVDTDVAVGSRQLTENATTDHLFLDCAGSVTFTSVAAGPTCTGVILYKVVGSAATDPLICWLEFSSPVVANGSDIQVNFNADGAVDIDIAP